MSQRPVYRVDITAGGQRELERLPRDAALRLRVAMKALRYDPRPAGATRLVGVDLWRIRVGDLRLVYAIDDARRRVVVARVARRAERTYRRLP